ARLGASGIDASQVERLRTARLVEVAGFTVNTDGENARDRETCRDAVEEAVEADLLILVVDVRRKSAPADVAFVQAWDRWFVEHPGLETPPALVVLIGIDQVEPGGEWKPPYDWARGQTSREAAVRGRIETLRASLSPIVTEYVAVSLAPGLSSGLTEDVLPAL